MDQSIFVFHFIIYFFSFLHISHRNTYVRRTSAQFLSALVEKMGSMKCLLGPRDIGEHLLPAAARFIQDGSIHTRYFGRRIFAILMQHPLFDKFLRKHISPGTYRSISGILETIKRRVSFFCLFVYHY